MIFVSGLLHYGKVERLGGACVVTVFRHAWWMPLFPIGSFVLGPDEKVVSIGWHGKSILAAYLRTWGVLSLLVCVVSAFDGSPDFVLPNVPVWIDVAVLGALVASAFFLLGRLSSGEIERRLVYSRFVGLPVDVARLSRGEVAPVRETLDAVFAQEGRALVSTYREAVDPVKSWQDLAIHPGVTSRAFLEAALTRARLDVSRAPRSERPRLREVHDAVWARLEAMDATGGVPAASGA